MTLRRALVFVLLWTAGVRVDAIDMTPRAVSNSRQFIVFCQDKTLRSRAVSLADDLRASVAGILEDNSRWTIPVVISLKPAETQAAEAVSFRLFETAEGSSIQIGICIGENPAEAHFQELIVRAVLLEYSLRNRPAIKGGEAYVEPPWWLVQAVVQMFASREHGVDTGLYRGVVQSSKVPEIGEFLATNNADLGDAAQAVDASYAMCLVQLLIEQPNGRANLARLVRHWPENHANPVSALTKEFPGMAASTSALQKWWTVNLARLSVLDRYKGLSSEATDKELSALLQFDLVINKAGEKKTFKLGQFEEFIKLPSFKAAMLNAQAAMVRLSLQTNALYRPIVADYEQIFSSLARGKTKGIAAQIEQAARYRTAVSTRMNAIADYLNWYEATQLGTRSTAFDSFLKAASDLAMQENKSSSNGAVKVYLDQLEQEF